MRFSKMEYRDKCNSLAYYLNQIFDTDIDESIMFDGKFVVKCDGSTHDISILDDNNKEFLEEK